MVEKKSRAWWFKLLTVLISIMIFFGTAQNQKSYTAFGDMKKSVAKIM